MEVHFTADEEARIAEIAARALVAPDVWVKEVVLRVLDGKEAYAALAALFDAPAQPNERLRKTLTTPAPWETP